MPAGSRPRVFCQAGLSRQDAVLSQTSKGPRILESHHCLNPWSSMLRLEFSFRRSRRHPRSLPILEQAAVAGRSGVEFASEMEPEAGRRSPAGPGGNCLHCQVGCFEQTACLGNPLACQPAQGSRSGYCQEFSCEAAWPPASVGSQVDDRQRLGQMVKDPATSFGEMGQGRSFGAFDELRLAALTVRGDDHPPGDPICCLCPVA